MIPIRTAAVITSVLGVLWALLSLTWHDESDSLFREFGTGIAVAATGLVIFYAAGWWEDRK